ncbi:hypothetical protein FNH22_10920 [Fulvivirga sp. M361]|uniref:WG repeat-containing protein n=1 Tax=Fulvivirga sp. M361 TaxID=2594266 RepID=UPI00117AB4BD|nr:WG repeat-containing protein [Fulvivirga sp. M361]TRX59034.1 hypothetical protein FNH22_10920 [Fulvivirga sp. M361]
MGRVVVIISFLALAVTAYGQAGLVKRGLKFHATGQLDKMEAIIHKSLDKDSTYPGAYHLKALLYFHPDYHLLNIDSALQYVNVAKDYFTGLDSKERDKLSKIGAGPIAMETLKLQIDSAGFARAVQENSEEAYLSFLSHFPKSRFESRAITERDLHAFEEAVRMNTYQSYLAFMKKYPKAVQYKQAKERYEKLYFDKSTADGKMVSYQKFLKQHPTTPYREEAERKIYEVMTAPNTVKGYTQFADQYPDSKKALQAKNFLFHLLKEQGKVGTYPQRFLADSLKALSDLDKPLITFLEKREYGFMDLRGLEVLTARFSQVSEDHLCGLVENDFIHAGQKVVAKDGSVIAPYAKEVTDLGYGWLKSGGNGLYHLVHKSGMKLTDRGFQDVKVLNGKFIAYHYKGAWDLMTMSGIVLTEQRFDDIFQLGEFLLFKKGKLLDVKISSEIIDAADNGALRFQMLFTDYELLEEGKLWLQSGYGEGVYDEQLNELIPYEKQEISFLPYGYLVEKKGAYQVLNDAFETIYPPGYDQVDHNTSYLAVKQDTLWTLLKAANYVEVAKALDSLVLLGHHFALGYRQDSTFLYSRNTASIVLDQQSRTAVLSSSGAAEFVQVTSERSTEVLNELGNNILSGKYDDAFAIGEYLIVSKKNKKGLYSMHGKLLSAEYDAIGSYKDSYVSLLKNKKFGLFSERDTVLVPPQYDKALEKYNVRTFVARKEGKVGLVDRKGEPLSKFIYNEVVYWNDTAALVRQNDGWDFYDLKNQVPLGQSLKSFSYTEQTDEEIIIIALGENGYGVISSQKGEVIPLSFNDVVNIGKPGLPVYFTETHIEEAEFYVVIYYDQAGKVIRKQALEAEDYDLIYCDR